MAGSISARRNVLGVPLKRGKKIILCKEKRGKGKKTRKKTEPAEQLRRRAALFPSRPEARLQRGPAITSTSERGKSVEPLLSQKKRRERSAQIVPIESLSEQIVGPILLLVSTAGD